jgi:ComF family protein
MKAISGLPITAGLLSSLLPASCRLCGVPVSHEPALCGDCQRELPGTAPACRQCGGRLGGPTQAGLCGQCQRHPPAFTTTCAALRYRPPVDYLIQRLKFSGELALAPLLAALLAERLGRRDQPPPGQLIPVPLHRSRLRERGFNQATEIARVLGRRLGLTVEWNLCRRTRHTATQSLLPASARRHNVRNAFVLDRPPQARHVAIVDDVMTSGHTVNELARLLQRAGVDTIEVWVVARAGR